MASRRLYRAQTQPKTARTSQNKPKQAKTSQNEPKQAKTSQHKPKQDKTTFWDSQQAKTSQNKPKHAKTRFWDSRELQNGFREAFNEPFAVSPYRGLYGGMHDRGPTSQKLETSSCPQSVDSNTHLRLSKCSFGLRKASPPSGAHASVWTSIR